MPSEEKLQQLDQQKRDVNEALRVLGRIKRKIQADLTLLKADLEIGDVLLSRGKQYCVVDADGMWPLGRLIKKDGTLGVQLSRIYTSYTKLGRYGGELPSE